MLRTQLKNCKYPRRPENDVTIFFLLTCRIKTKDSMLYPETVQRFAAMHISANTNVYYMSDDKRVMKKS